MYKIVVCDLDETLIGTDRTISEKNRKAIARLKDFGIKFVPSSGRNFISIDSNLKDLGLCGEENEYVISFNGGAITENKNHKLLHFEGISFELASELYKRGMNYDVCTHVYTKDMVYAYNLFQAEIDYLAGRMEIKEIFDKNIDFLKGQDIVKCLYTNTDREYLQKIAEDLKDITGGIDVSYSANRYLEFNKRGVNKGEGLKKLAEILNVDIKDTIAIGDNFNDLSMIKVAGLGVFVANAVEDIKKYGDYVCENDCDHDAVAEVLEKFIFNA